MPRTSDLLGIAHTFCQRAQCWEFFPTFMLLNQACMTLGLRSYTLDLLTETALTPELAGLPFAARLPTWLRTELVRLLCARGFDIDGLSLATVAIDVLPEGDGSLYGIRATFMRNGRVIVRALDPSGKVVPLV
jgi:hypothetical protein